MLLGKRRPHTSMRHHRDWHLVVKCPQNGPDAVPAQSALSSLITFLAGDEHSVAVKYEHCHMYPGAGCRLEEARQTPELPRLAPVAACGLLPHQPRSPKAPRASQSGFTRTSLRKNSSLPAEINRLTTLSTRFATPAWQLSSGGTAVCRCSDTH